MFFVPLMNTWDMSMLARVCMIFHFFQLAYMILLQDLCKFPLNQKQSLENIMLVRFFYLHFQQNYLTKYGCN